MIPSLRFSNRSRSRFEAFETGHVPSDLHFEHRPYLVGDGPDAKGPESAVDGRLTADVVECTESRVDVADVVFEFSLL